MKYSEISGRYDLFRNVPGVPVGGREVVHKIDGYVRLRFSIGIAVMGTIGCLEDGTVTVIFATLGTEAISVISMRPASLKERRLLDA